MRRIFAALAVFGALFAASAPAAWAQDAENAAMVRAFAAWSDRIGGIQTGLGEANGAIRRLNAAVRQARGDRAAMLAAFSAARPDLEQARTMLQALRTEAEAIPPFSHEHAPAMYIVTSNLVLSDTIWMLERFEAAIGELLQMSAALEAGDNARVMEIANRLMSLPAVFLRTLSTSFRLTQLQYPESDTSHHALGVRLAVLEAMLAIVTLDEAADTTGVTAAADAVDRWVASGLVALAGERAANTEGDAETRAGLERMFAIHDQQLALAAQEAALIRGYAHSLTPRSLLPARLDAVRAVNALEAQQEALQDQLAAEARALLD